MGSAAEERGASSAGAWRACSGAARITSGGAAGEEAQAMGGAATAAGEAPVPGEAGTGVLGGGGASGAGTLLGATLRGGIVGESGAAPSERLASAVLRAPGLSTPAADSGRAGDSRDGCTDGAEEVPGAGTGPTSSGASPTMTTLCGTEGERAEAHAPIPCARSVLRARARPRRK
jgi:hypothetical protein